MSATLPCTVFLNTRRAVSARSGGATGQQAAVRPLLKRADHHELIRPDQIAGRPFHSCDPVRQFTEV